MGNTARTLGVSERVLYGVILGVVTQFATWGWFDPNLAPWVAGGVFMLVSGSYGWWLNRPEGLLADAKSANTASAMLTAAATTVPKNAELQIVTTPDASHAEKVEVRAIAAGASDKVLANVKG